VSSALALLPVDLPLRNPSLSGSSRWEEQYWPLHTPLKREILTLDAKPGVVLEGHRVRKCAFWKKFLPQLGNSYYGIDKAWDSGDNHTNGPALCPPQKISLPDRQDMMVLHTVAFVLFVIAFVLLVVKISFMVASVLIKACSTSRPTAYQRSEMTNVVVSSY
jgi:hypothetical protein